MLRRLLLTLGFVAMGIAIAATGGWFAALVGGSNVVIFGGFSAMMLAAFRKRGSVAIDVSPEGVWWRQWSDHTIAWTDVRHAEIRQQHLSDPMRPGQSFPNTASNPALSPAAR